MIATLNFPTLLHFPLGDAREELNRVVKKMSPLAGANMATPLGVTQTVPDPTLLHDALTDTDGVLLTSHTIAPINRVSATWLATTHTSFKILDNAAASDATNRERSNLFNAGRSDLIYRVRVKRDTDSPYYKYLIARAAAPASSFAFNTQHLELWYHNNPSNGWKFMSWNSGVATELGFYAYTWATGTFIEIEWTMRGINHTIKIDDVTVIEYAGATPSDSNTLFGIYNGYTYNPTDSRYDDITVEE